MIRRRRKRIVWPCMMCIGTRMSRMSMQTLEDNFVKSVPFFHFYVGSGDGTLNSDP